MIKHSNDWTKYLDQFFSNLPREDSWIVLLVLFNFSLHFRRRHPGLRTPDNSWPNGPSLLISVEDFWDAAVTDAKLTRNDARSNSGRGHFDDLESDVIGKRPAVDEDASQLVDAALTFEANKSQR